MKWIRLPSELRSTLDKVRAQGERVGLVPTMGALHAGHLSLCRASCGENDRTVVSIFVNPTQFGPGEDYGRYPRDLKADGLRLESEGVDFVFIPEPGDIYPAGFQTYVSVEEIARRWEGEARPGHFRGVATVVLKLFLIAGLCRVYFGEKDYQQLQVVRRMVTDLSVPVEVIGVPTVREPDGLAMSSRNRYLSPEERMAAPAIYRALCQGQEMAAAGERDAVAILQTVGSCLAEESLVRPEYVALVDAESLEPLLRLEGHTRLLAGARVGPARLIDNVAIGGRLNGS